MILNGKVFNPGEMRTKITLKSRSISTETGRFQKPAWSTIATVWAKWVNVHGVEAWTAMQTMAGSQLATVTMRYRAGIDLTYQVVNGSLTYEIVSIDDIQERHEYLELKVKRVTSG